MKKKRQRFHIRISLTVLCFVFLVCCRFARSTILYLREVLGYSMADLSCRTLRDGVVEGEHAPALTIADSLQTIAGPSVFHYYLRSIASNVSSGKAQAKGLVVVAFSRSPTFYVDLLERFGIDTRSHSWFQVLDCYTDPLGWKEKLLGDGKCDHTKKSERYEEHTFLEGFTVCRDVRNMEGLMSAIIASGKGAIGSQGKARFSVGIDLVSIMIRHLSLPLVSNLLNNLRCHDQISSLFWLLHSDLHDSRTVSALEYMSSMVAVLDPILPPLTDSLHLKRNSDKFASVEDNLTRGKLCLRVKRRNGRVREQIEEFAAEQADVKFSPVSLGKSVVTGSSNLPQVQFNLQLTDKEREDRAKVILPFEHQGNGKEIHIYDGRRGSTLAVKTSAASDSNTVEADSDTAPIIMSKEGGVGEIHYVRDSDDEPPDSDEDPDDDLDI